MCNGFKVLNIVVSKSKFVLIFPLVFSKICCYFQHVSLKLAYNLINAMSFFPKLVCSCLIIQSDKKCCALSHFSIIKYQQNSIRLKLFFFNSSVSKNLLFFRRIKIQFKILIMVLNFMEKHYKMEFVLVIHLTFYVCGIIIF